MSAVRLLFVGCGSIAGHHLRAVEQSSVKAEVVGAVDPNKDTAEAFVRQVATPNGCKV